MSKMKNLCESWRKLYFRYRKYERKIYKLMFCCSEHSSNLIYGISSKRQWIVLFNPVLIVILQPFSIWSSINFNVWIPEIYMWSNSADVTWRKIPMCFDLMFNLLYVLISSFTKCIEPNLKFRIVAILCLFFCVF